MGMYDNFLDILNVFRNDEKLLRLLYYPPENLATETLDPLDPTLPNILDIDKNKLKEIRNEHIMKSAKADDLDEKQLCRIYVYPGRRDPSDNNYLVCGQEIVIDILCHNSFENEDLRSMRISDELNKLLVHERLTGMGKMEYVRGIPRSAPTEYIGYQHIYRFWATKK